ncbi:MAG: hypothetical protein ACI4QT_10350 [Kiritimatiellia bacterium]
MKNRITPLFLLSCFGILHLQAETLSWSGAADDQDFLNPDNWTPAQSFTAADTLIIDGTNVSAPILLRSDAEFGTLQLTNKTQNVSLLAEGAARLKISGVLASDDKNSEDVISSSATSGTNQINADIVLSGTRQARIKSSKGTLWLSGNISEETEGMPVLHSRNDASSQRLVTGQNTYSGITSLNSDTLTVSSLGMAGQPSAIGRNKQINIGYKGSRTSILAYIGNGETTDKDFQWGGGTGSSSFHNRSKTGPVEFTGSFLFPDYGTLNLSGSNPGTNIVHCPIVNPQNSGGTDATKLGVNLTSIDTSTWLFTGDNTHTDTTEINYGTLLLAGDNSAATGEWSVKQNATLGGTTTLGGSVSLMGTLKPGLPKGELAIAQDLTIGEKNYGTIACSPDTSLLVKGTFQIIGKWKIDISEGFQPGGEFVLLEYGAMAADSETYETPTIKGSIPTYSDGTAPSVECINDGNRLILAGIHSPVTGSIIVIH